MGLSPLLRWSSSLLKTASCPVVDDAAIRVEIWCIRPVTSRVISRCLIRLNCHKKCQLVSEADRIWQEATNLATFTFWQPEARDYMPHITFGPKLLTEIKCVWYFVFEQLRTELRQSKDKVSWAAFKAFPDPGNLNWRCSGSCYWVGPEHLIWTFYFCGRRTFSIRDKLASNWMVRNGTK